MIGMKRQSVIQWCNYLCLTYKAKHHTGGGGIITNPNSFSEPETTSEKWYLKHFVFLTYKHIAWQVLTSKKVFWNLKYLLDVSFGSKIVSFMINILVTTKQSFQEKTNVIHDPQVKIPVEYHSIFHDRTISIFISY